MKREMMNQINRIVLNVLYRGLRVLYHKDSRVRAEMGSYDSGGQHKGQTEPCPVPEAPIAKKHGGNAGKKTLPLSLAPAI